MRATITIVFLFVIIVSLLIIDGEPTVVQIPSHYDGPAAVDALNWSQFAYTQYVTNTAYLCISVML
ncbi:unnamed protein product [Penicillium roqueforti FM164]|uniref:Uncharacterized protein n=1 Tax=Penicillium roqueforti (strain FM164) TaxID=1365484 RepID=W6QMV5_PENRF|nr:unnamed protein product [Penicillium roqueforti FM164]